MKTIEDIQGRCFINDEGHWLWRGAVRPSGSPNILAPDYTKGGAMTTQAGKRAVWHCVNQRALPAGWRVWGTCDEIACCNPEHVMAGNGRAYGDWVRRSGKLKGQINRILANRAINKHRSVLTPESLTHILASNQSGVKLAAELGISKSVVSKARRGQMVVVRPAGMFSALMAA